MTHKTVLAAGHTEKPRKQRLETTTFTKYGTVFAAMTDKPEQTLYAMAIGDTLYRGESFGGMETLQGVRYRSTQYARRIHELYSRQHDMSPEMRESEAVKQNTQLRAVLAALIEWVEDVLDGPLRRLYGARVDATTPAIRRAMEILEAD